VRAGEGATSSPVTKTVCLHGKCWANTVHFGQQDDVITLRLSHQELAVERNVDVSEELLQGRVGVQEQQPGGFFESVSTKSYKKLPGVFFHFYRKFSSLNVT